MKRITEWIVSKTIKDHENVDDPKVRSSYGMLEGWSSIIVNIILFIVKLVIGISIRSVALIADAVHTIFDSVTSVVVMVGFKAAEKPSDKEHPFGHGRFEPVATLIIAVLLFVTGIELLKSSVKVIVEPGIRTVNIRVLIIIAVAVLIKELLARFSKQLGIKINSKTIMADYIHHRSDVLATALVLIGLALSRYGFLRIDGITGILVSLIIIYSGYRIGREAISPLLGEAPSPEVIKRIKNIAQKTGGVVGVHDIIFHAYGQTRLSSLHVEVSDETESMEMHRISETVEQSVAKGIKGAVVVHVDPVNRNHPLYDNVCGVIDSIVKENNSIHSFHELRIVGARGKLKAVFDIVLNKDIKKRDVYRTKQLLSEEVKAKFSDMEVVVNVDPEYVYNP